MLRGGGLCVAGPTGDPSITKISPRIRALQDRLMDSLPSEGAWECLSPAQREAILSIHRSRTASTDDSSEHGEGGLGRHHHHHHHHAVVRKHAPPQSAAVAGGGAGGFRRFVRSRSYDDRLESETDDSGVRGVNGTSSGTTSHNSLEDDSSDNICLKRGPGRFTKAASADRAVTRREGKADPHEINSGKNIRKSEVVTNGFGNVNKIISKQMNKCSVMPTGPSNITLDCRNVQGEKRRRSRIDVDDPFRECSVERNLEAIRENETPRRNVGAGNDSQQTRLGLNRRNVIENFDSETKLHSLKEMKETGSSEEYDSGVNLKNDDSMDEYVRERQNNGCEFNNNDFESDRTPRSDSSTSPTVPHKRERSLDNLKCKGDDLTVRKPSAERDPYGGWERSLDKFDKSRPREREGRSGAGLSHSLDKHPDRSKSNKTAGEPLKSNLKVGYGAKLNSSFDYRTNLNQDQMNKYSSNWNNIILSKDVPIKPSTSVANVAHASAAAAAAAASGRESRFAKNTSAGAMTRSTGNLANKSAMAAAHRKADPMSWMLNDPRRTPNPSQDRAGSKKYIRSKSLDRKYLDDDSSDDDSDFETRRRTDRVRRYQRATQDWDVARSRVSDEKGRQRGRDELEARQLKRHTGGAGHPVKAKSVWDLTGHMKKGHDDFDEFDEVGFRTRSDFRNKWQSEDSDVTRRRKLSDNSEFSRVQWNRRSCDFELDFPSDDLDRRSGDRLDFDRKRWYRRSCDLDLDYELHHSRQRREVDFDADWGRHALENCEEFGPEFVMAKGKKSRAEQQQQQLQKQSRNKSRCEDLLMSEKRRGGGEEQQQGRQTRMENESGRRTRLEDSNERRLHMEEDSGRRTRLEDDPGRRTRLEEYYRAKTSMGHHGGKEKRERSRTPHLLRGKLRLLKSILSF